MLARTSIADSSAFSKRAHDDDDREQAPVHRASADGVLALKSINDKRLLSIPRLFRAGKSRHYLPDTPELLRSLIIKSIQSRCAGFTEDFKGY
ncbi:hypothetical protein QO002_002799 [Pararhizobium capsulatum DSM 1112]|uniref:Transposase n=1 Tax=Pararhizobium capsulatum DSM 1112 TaxID=1121113 RepID=A0ABU0BSN9_9HYPH|nr:hypothetical protein [Pararhizobium capsulatum DSM 1112]